jgi:hypothetical protein
VGQSPNGYLGFHSPISYTNTTPTSSGDETPRTVQLPSFTLYRSSPACPSEGRNEKQGTFVRVGDFPSPNNPKDNVDWRQYEVIEGNSYATRNSGIAPTVLRTDTKGGAQKKKVRRPFFGVLSSFWTSKESEGGAETDETDYLYLPPSV